MQKRERRNEKPYWDIDAGWVCKYGPVQALHTDLETKLEAAKTDQWTIECAPVEMAVAESHKAFAD